MTPERAIARLNEFAQRRGPAGVARALRLFGVRGEQGEACSCPLAVYLQLRCPDHSFYVAVDGKIEHRPASVCGIGPSFRGDFGEPVKTGPALDEFAAGFDVGQYPSLILPSTH